MDMKPVELLTIPEAAAVLRLKVSTIRAWVLHRRIPYVKIGRLVRIRRSDAEAVVTAGLVSAQIPKLGAEDRGARI